MKKYFLNEVVYPGNIGFEELVKYYEKATDKQISDIEKLIKKKDWEGFKKQINKVLGIKLQ